MTSSTSVPPMSRPSRVQPAQLAHPTREKTMRRQLYASAITVTLLFGLGSAAAQNVPGPTPGGAQGPLHLTDDQKQAVMHGLKGEQTQSLPVDAHPQVGNGVPDATTMHQLPNDVASQVP